MDHLLEVINCIHKLVLAKWLSNIYALPHHDQTDGVAHLRQDFDLALVRLGEELLHAVDALRCTLLVPCKASDDSSPWERVMATWI